MLMVGTAINLTAAVEAPARGQILYDALDMIDQAATMQFHRYPPYLSMISNRDADFPFLHFVANLVN